MRQQQGQEQFGKVAGPQGETETAWRRGGPTLITGGAGYVCSTGGPLGTRRGGIVGCQLQVLWIPGSDLGAIFTVGLVVHESLYNP